MSCCPAARLCNGDRRPGRRGRDGEGQVVPRALDAGPALPPPPDRRPPDRLRRGSHRQPRDLNVLGHGGRVQRGRSDRPRTRKPCTSTLPAFSLSRSRSLSFSLDLFFPLLLFCILGLSLRYPSVSLLSSSLCYHFCHVLPMTPPRALFVTSPVA